MKGVIEVVVMCSGSLVGRCVLLVQGAGYLTGGLVEGVAAGGGLIGVVEVGWGRDEWIGSRRCLAGRG